ncbi:MAG TPA: hypothetical protein VFQ00_11545 [Terriglobales bacterium]|nr:hypothetical protein [Terriglobales bacterium]
MEDIKRQLRAGAAKVDSAVELDLATLRELKKAVDGLRRALWVQIEAEHRKSGKKLKEEVRSLRLQNLTEMLQSVQEDLKVRELRPTSETASFLNAVHKIADAALERHTPASHREKAG